MTADCLLTDDLEELLSVFPNERLRELLAQMGKFKSWSPFPSARATEAHQASVANVDFRPFAPAIAREIVWWGSNDLASQFMGPLSWREVVLDVARVVGVRNRALREDAKAWEIEHAILSTAMTSWESLTPEKRKEILAQAGLHHSDYMKAVSILGGGVLFRAAIVPAATALGLQGAVAAAATSLIMPISISLAAAWTGYVSAGPAYRVLKPVALSIAVTRRQLIDARAAEAFEF